MKKLTEKPKLPIFVSTRNQSSRHKQRKRAPRNNRGRVMQEEALKQAKKLNKK